MDTYLGNSGSRIILEVDGSGGDPNVTLTLLIDVDDNGVADAGITFIDSGLTLSDLLTADEAFFQGLPGFGDVEVSFGPDGGTSGVLDADGDTAELTNLPDHTAIDALLGGAPVQYDMTFQDDINPFADRAYDPLGEGFSG
jgi:hypothetical protein